MAPMKITPRRPKSSLRGSEIQPALRYFSTRNGKVHEARGWGWGRGEVTYKIQIVM